MKESWKNVVGSWKILEFFVSKRVGTLVFTNNLQINIFDGIIIKQFTQTVTDIINLTTLKMSE